MTLKTNWPGHQNTIDALIIESCDSWLNGFSSHISKQRMVSLTLCVFFKGCYVSFLVVGVKCDTQLMFHLLWCLYLMFSHLKDILEVKMKSGFLNYSYKMLFLIIVPHNLQLWILLRSFSTGYCSKSNPRKQVIVRNSASGIFGYKLPSQCMYSVCVLCT